MVSVIAIRCIRTAYARRPSFSGVIVGTLGTTVDGAFSAASGNAVVASHHVGKCRCSLMAWCLAIAGCARVIRVHAEAMGPTVVISSLLLLSRGWGVGRRWGGNSCSGIGAVHRDKTLKVVGAHGDHAVAVIGALNRGSIGRAVSCCNRGRAS